MAALIWAPEIGLAAFWNVLIPVAPALLALAPGLWRNICPLATTAMLPHRLGLSLGRRLSERGQVALFALAILLLLLVVPYRHVTLNTDGPATGILVATLALAAFLLGLAFQSKSGWCSSLCPVHPVERLYGPAPIASLSNAHCGNCRLCVRTCPESTTDGNGTLFTLFVGCFPGFVWGFFQVADGSGVKTAYGYPLVGAGVTLASLIAFRSLLPTRHHRILVRAWATLAISCYYWYRIPMLFGFGDFGDGMLVDLRGSLPEFLPWASRGATTAFFAWWLMARYAVRRSWTVRPPIASTAAQPVRV
jgi:ferredoxin